MNREEVEQLEVLLDVLETGQTDVAKVWLRYAIARAEKDLKEPKPEWKWNSETGTYVPHRG